MDSATVFDVAIIGGGPSGLASAKACLESNLTPQIFEQADDLGGLWRPAGFVWPKMRTNLSKWTCCFSDFPWSDESDEFPLAADVHNYLRAYADAFSTTGLVANECKVTRVLRQKNHWVVEYIENRRLKTRRYRFVIVASGAFSVPFVPKLEGRETSGVFMLHSSEYRGADSLRGNRVVVVGASLSSIEIAAAIADEGRQVTLVLPKPTWVLPRYFQGEGQQDIPIDLLLYRRAPNSTKNGPEEQRNVESAQKLQDLFGNPGKIHPDLLVPISAAPPNVAISETFLAHVADGRITPVRGKTEALLTSGIRLQSGQEVCADTVVMCTGYRMQLPFLTSSVLEAIEFLETDGLLPVILDRTVMRRDVEGLFFVGCYKGPFIGVVELQARWAAAVAAGSISPKLNLESLENERRIRSSMPRPQFPHPNYVEFCDSIACELDAVPHSEDAKINTLLSSGPVTPAQFRLQGIGSNRVIAETGIIAACKRAGITSPERRDEKE